MSVQGQRVAIVGGTSGIGLAVAQAVVGDGGDVVLASRNKANIERAVAELGPHASGQALDVLDADAADQFFDSIEDVDHLVYTAGEPLSMMPINGLDLDQARDFFQTRFFGVLNVVRAAVPHLRPGGSITLTSGTAGDRAGAGWALGASVCGAVNSVTRALAIELAPIRVNAVAPGVLRSPLWSQLSEEDRAGMYAQLGAALPLGRVGEVDDVAQAYLYCLNQSYGTGTVLHVDGGTLLV